MKKLFMLCFIVSCSAMPVMNPTPTPTPIEPSDTSWCARGCEYLMSLPGPDGDDGCLEARPLVYSDGFTETCTHFCEETQKNGRALQPRCWVEKVKKCEDIEPLCRSVN